ncbi:hypothetical protein BC827DRAFT_588555 [Russula dissimulans]|nr:hypothetical protein BC827DRAFT_588555 [Russula dissimulans]
MSQYLIIFLLNFKFRARARLGVLMASAYTVGLTSDLQLRFYLCILLIYRDRLRIPSRITLSRVIVVAISFRVILPTPSALALLSHLATPWNQHFPVGSSFPLPTCQMRSMTLAKSPSAISQDKRSPLGVSSLFARPLRDAP